MQSGKRELGETGGKGWVGEGSLGKNTRIQESYPKISKGHQRSSLSAHGPLSSIVPLKISRGKAADFPESLAKSGGVRLGKFELEKESRRRIVLCTSGSDGYGGWSKKKERGDREL